MKSLTLIAPTLILIAILAGCGTSGSGSSAPETGAAGASGSVAVKRYPMHGKILSVDAAGKSMRIDAGPIGDWMPTAMTMNYPVRDDAPLAKLKAGSAIDATVFVQGDDFWIGEIKPVQ